MNGFKLIKRMKTFLDGSILWIELQDPETGETTIQTGREYERWKKEGDSKQTEDGTAQEG